MHTGGVGQLVTAYLRARGRRVTPRRIRQIHQQIAAAGLMDPNGRPARGRPAIYRALGVEARRAWLVIRPRGVAPKHLHRAFAGELAAARPDFTGPP